MKLIKIFTVVIAVAFGFNRCTYLDVVPDNMPTVENAFADRIQLEKYLYTCYSYLPEASNISKTPAYYAGNEFSYSIPASYLFSKVEAGFKIRDGYQNSNVPLLNFWDGEEGGKALYQGIRDCNIFLENVNKVLDPNLLVSEKNRWTAEVTFLKAYYHWYLLRMYGPIPLVKENLPVSVAPEQTRVYREPIDTCVNYIAGLLSQASRNLPDLINVHQLEDGRITKPVALAVKAQMLTWAASPLVNGNTENGGIMDKRGIQLIPQIYKPEKWIAAAAALDTCIKVCENLGMRLYKYTTASTYNMNDTVKDLLSIRRAVTTKWEDENPERVWGCNYPVEWSGYAGESQSMGRICSPIVNLSDRTVFNKIGWLGASFRMAELFYTEHGVPISEDNTNLYPKGLYELRSAGVDHKDFITQNGEKTIALHFNRERRFYADMGFDRGIWEGNGRPITNRCVLQMRSGEPQGYMKINSGYMVKKLVHYETISEGLGGAYVQYSGVNYTFPIIRLADLYLLQSEVLNELSNNVPGKTASIDQIFEKLNLVRARARLESVQDSWRKYSTNPSKPNTYEGRREIIRQERKIEMAFEGTTYWDLKRWKLYVSEMNIPFIGWNYNGETEADFYKKTTYENNNVMSAKDNWFPIKGSDLIINRNLEQNPGW